MSKRTYLIATMLTTFAAFILSGAAFIGFPLLTHTSGNGSAGIQLTYNPQPITVGLADTLAPTFVAKIEEFVSQNDKYSLVSAVSPDVYITNNWLDPQRVSQRGSILEEVYFVPVTNFSSQIESTTSESIQNTFTNNSSPFTRALLLSNNTGDVTSLFNTLEGVIFYDSIEDLIANIQPTDIALVPFNKLNPKLKVVSITGGANDGSIIDKDYQKNWQLTAYYMANGDSAKTFTEDFRGITPLTNRDPNKLSTLIMTGVTAISRGVEYEITKRNDPIFPARGIMDVLSKADLTHINNENPLFDSCVPENEGIILCGRTRSIESFNAIGADIVGMTGNHQNDYGPEKNLESIGHLTEAGFEHYGGGVDQADAEKILYKEIGETKIAFMGYAYFDSLNGPEYVSLAFNDRPGANYYSEEKLIRDVAIARQNADIVIVEYQFIENYSYEPIPGQIETFEMTSALGADLVMGVQSHQPQWIRFHQREDGSSGMIFYGLGNLFFDQMWSTGTRQGIIPRFTFYDGQLISAEILTTLLYDYAQPRFTEGTERNKLLKLVLP